jgi:hypothetical protein
MKIEREHLRRQWWEDEEGNFLQEPDYETLARPDEGRYFVSRIPQVLDTVYVRVDDDGQTEIGQSRQSWNEDLALAIAYRSNGWSLTDGIMIASLACERCMNALAYEANLNWGYPEFGEEWQETDTECQFCVPNEAETRWPEGTLAEVVGGFGPLQVSEKVEIVSASSVVDSEGNFVEHRYNVRVRPERARASEDPGRIEGPVPASLLSPITDDPEPEPEPVENAPEDAGEPAERNQSNGGQRQTNSGSTDAGSE